MQKQKGRYEATENFIILQATEGPGINDHTVNYTGLYEADGESLTFINSYSTWEGAQAALERCEKRRVG